MSGLRLSMAGGRRVKRSKENEISEYAFEQIMSVIADVTRRIYEAFDATVDDLHPRVRDPILRRMKEELAKRGLNGEE